MLFIENLREVLNTVIIDTGIIKIDFADLIIIMCLSIMMCGQILILLCMLSNKKK